MPCFAIFWNLQQVPEDHYTVMECDVNCSEWADDSNSNKSRAIEMEDEKSPSTSQQYGMTSRLARARRACTLTLYGPNSFFRRFSGHNLR